MRLFKTATGLALALTFGVAGCSPAYSSFYKGTNSRAAGQPVPASNVKIVASKDDLVATKWTEVGQFRGKAPTVREAMLSARQACGRNGAEFYILNTKPYQSDNGFRVDGICAAKQ